MCNGVIHPYQQPSFVWSAGMGGQVLKSRVLALVQVFNRHFITEAIMPIIRHCGHFANFCPTMTMSWHSCDITSLSFEDTMLYPFAVTAQITPPYNARVVWMKPSTLTKMSLFRELTLTRVHQASFRSIFHQWYHTLGHLSRLLQIESLMWLCMYVWVFRSMHVLRWTCQSPPLLPCSVPRIVISS